MDPLKKPSPASASEPDQPTEEHAVLLHLPLSDDEFGAESERASIQQLSDQLESTIEEKGVGEFDGDEFGGGTCTLFMYGPDADVLWEAIESMVRSSHHSFGGHVIRRYGSASDPTAREVRLNL